MEETKSKSYTLRGEHGEWLGQIVLTSNGMFSSVTDYGNLSYAWRAFGKEAEANRKEYKVGRDEFVDMTTIEDEFDYRFQYRNTDLSFMIKLNDKVSFEIKDGEAVNVRLL